MTRRIIGKALLDAHYEGLGSAATIYAIVVLCLSVGISHCPELVLAPCNY